MNFFEIFRFFRIFLCFFRFFFGFYGFFSGFFSGFFLDFLVFAYFSVFSDFCGFFKFFWDFRFRCGLAHLLGATTDAFSKRPWSRDDESGVVWLFLRPAREPTYFGAFIQTPAGYAAAIWQRCNVPFLLPKVVSLSRKCLRNGKLDLLAISGTKEPTRCGVHLVASAGYLNGSFSRGSKQMSARYRRRITGSGGGSDVPHFRRIVRCSSKLGRTNGKIKSCSDDMSW